MFKRVIGIALLFALVAFATPALAGTAEQKVALRQAAKAAAERIGKAVPADATVKSRGIGRVHLLVDPPGFVAGTVYRAIEQAFDGVEGYTMTWSKVAITEFVDMVYIDAPERPGWRYDPRAVLKLGSFRQAQAVLFAHYEVEEGVSGGTRAEIDLQLWDGRTAERIWGANVVETVDLSLLAKLIDMVDGGQIDEALIQIEKARADAPQWKAELDLLQKRAETLKAHAKDLALIRGHLNLSQVDDALLKIQELYKKGDASLHDALSGLHTDLRLRVLGPVKASIDAGDFEGAKNRLAALAAKFSGDLVLREDLIYLGKRLRAQMRRRLIAPIEALIEGDSVPKKLLDEATAKVKELEAKYPADTELQAELNTLKSRIEKKRGIELEPETKRTLLYVLGGLLAVVILGLILGKALGKRKRVTVRNRGIDELVSAADQADRVKDALQKDSDVRERMLRELDRSEDALAEAHHKAQQAGKADMAKNVHDASQHLQELRRRVKLVQAGDPQDFLKGRLPKKNLEGLMGFIPALAGQISELSKEAMAAQDSVAAGGDPAKNLKLLSGIALQIQGKLAERDAFFEKTV